MEQRPIGTRVKISGTSMTGTITGISWNFMMIGYIVTLDEPYDQPHFGMVTTVSTPWVETITDDQEIMDDPLISEIDVADLCGSNPDDRHELAWRAERVLAAIQSTFRHPLMNDLQHIIDSLRR